MGIFIPNMKLPTGCDTCPFEVFGDCYGGKAKLIMDIDEEIAMGIRHKKCPLVHVPEPGMVVTDGHGGRMIIGEFYLEIAPIGKGE